MDNIEKYRQLMRMGPRRSGRSVGNLLAAANAVALGGTATVVVANYEAVPQTSMDINDFVPDHLAKGIAIATLYNVEKFRGPFFIDHYAYDKMENFGMATISKQAGEIKALKDQVRELLGRFE